MNYVITYSSYPDCPSCQGGLSYDEEFIYSSGIIRGKGGVIKFLLDNVNKEELLAIYQTKQHGELELVSKIETKTGFHNVVSLSFTLDGKRERVIKGSQGWELESDAHKILYGPNQKTTKKQPLPA